MSSDQFEHRLREKFKEASIPPSDHLWANIEKEVQGKSSKRGFFWWYFYGEGLVLSVLLLIYFFLPSTFQSTDLPAEAQQTKTFTHTEPSQPIDSSAESNVISIGSDQETTQLSTSTPIQEPTVTQRSQTSTSEVKSYFLIPIQHTTDLNRTLSSISIPEKSLILSKKWMFIDTIPAFYPTLSTNHPLQLTELEELIPPAKRSRWAWELNYAYLRGTDDFLPLSLSLNEDAFDEGRDNIIVDTPDAPDPNSAQAPPTDRDRAFTLTHGQGTHLIGLGTSYLLNKNLFLETGLNVKISEKGEIVENTGFQALTMELVLGSPVNRAVQPEARTFRQYALSIPLGVGVQLGKGRTKFRLSGGAQFEGLRNNATIELADLQQSPRADLFSAPSEENPGEASLSEWQYQTQLYFSGRILHQINRSMHLQLGAQFQFLQLPSGSSLIANGQDSQGGLQLGIIWTPMKGKIFKSAHP